MTRPVLIAHAAGDEEHAARLAAPIAAAGYRVVHGGTVLVGESAVEEVSRALGAGAPVVLCGTIRAMGTGWAHRTVHAARALDPQIRIYGVAVEQEVYLQPLTLDGVIAEYWRDPVRAIEAVITALRQHYPTAPAALPAGRSAAAEQRFRDLLLRSCDIIDLANLPADRRLATQELMLRNLFLPLTVRVESEAGPDPERILEAIEQRRVTGGRATSATPDPGELEPPGARLAAGRRLVVLGDPGSGKTTLLRWMATAYLLRLRADAAWAELPGVETLPDEDWLPVLVRCRDLGPAQVDGTLDEVLGHVLRRAELTPAEIEAMRAELDERLEAGTALLLIDGLDEIGDPRARARFAELLERVHISRPRVPIVVTSRIVGYREMGRRLGRGFEHVTIADLDAPAKDDFVRRWCAITEPPDRRQSTAEVLIADIHGTDRIERLTGNPMLLTTLALVKRSIGRLPDHRADLYAAAVQVLLTWRPEVDEPVSPREAEPQLQYLAYAMSDRGVQQLTEDEALDLLERMRAEYPQLRAIQRHDPADFLRLLERRTGILVETGHVRRSGRLTPLVEFRHLTFQEYLTAQAMVEGHFPGRAAEDPATEDLAAHAGRLTARVDTGDQAADTWQETIRLCVTMCHGDHVDALLAAVLERNPVLAARCLLDEPDAGADVIAGILRALATTLPADPAAAGVTYALADTAWADDLVGHLVRELRSRGPGAVPTLGGLIGEVLVERRAFRGEEPTAESFLADLAADDDRAVTAALAFEAAELPNDGPGSEPVQALLDLLERPDPLAAGAAAWTLLRIQLPFDDCWWRDGDLHRMIAVADGSDISTRLSLIEVVGPRRWPGAVPALTEAAGDADPANQIKALLLLGRSGSESALPALIRAVGSDVPAVRVAAVAGLGWLRSSAAAPVLLPRLSDRDPEVRAAAAEALGELGESPATGPLIAALDDPQKRVRYRVAQALGKIGDSAAVAPLLAALARRPEGELRWYLIDALAELGDGRPVPELMSAVEAMGDSAFWPIFALGTLGDRRARDVVRRHLSGERPTSWAVRVLGELGGADPADRSVIEEAAASSDPDLREKAADALHALGDDAALDRLLGLVADPVDEVRAQTARVLDIFATTRAATALVALAGDESGKVRARAIASLGAIRLDSEFAAIAVSVADPAPDVRRAAVVALGNYGDDRARELLLAAASADETAAMRSAAATALGQAHGEPVRARLLRMAADYDPDVRARALESFGAAGATGARAVLTARLDDPDATVRARAATGLGLLLDDAAIGPLTGLLADPQPAVRSAAAEALGSLDSGRAAEVLIARAADPAPEVRREIAVALDHGGQPAARPALRAFLSDSHPQVRAAAAEAMAVLGPADRLEALLPMLADPHPDVRRGAIWALDEDCAAAELLPLLDDPHKDVQTAAVWTLGLIGDRAAAPRLRALLSEIDGDQRAITIEALSRLDGPEALPLLAAALDDPYPAVRFTAIAEIRHARDVAWASRLRVALADAESTVRAEAARSLADLGDLDAVGPLIQMLRGDPAPRVRSHAAGALYRLGAPPARSALAAATTDVHPDVRQVAALGLAALGDRGPLDALRERMAESNAAGRRSLIGALAAAGDPAARRLVRIGLVSPSWRVRQLWATAFTSARPDQFERDLLTEHRSGGQSELDPARVIDRRRIERMARVLWRTPAEIRAAYVQLSGQIPLRVDD
ncbi:HEAT repeat domain-containing protein [Actinoplanes sp. NPDC026619]|uniref:HEAT repeat domain-containing protein n=1 Tax=Actinoplanes sp. NPDC026619 TaxID=3155798 RepID=UPI0033E6778D